MPPNPPVLVRRGPGAAPVVPPGLAGAGWSNHCQMPTPWRRDAQTLRIYYCSRDAQNQAHVFWVDLRPGPPWDVLGHSDGPVLGLGALGAFDAAGVMPTAIVPRDGAVWMYYIGWSVRKDVPYHNAIGLAVSHDQGNSFARMQPGPIVSTGPTEPYFCGTADVARVGDRWMMWYMSTTEWRRIGGRCEPRYHLKQAVSADGITWDHGRDVAVDYRTEDEGGVARATVLPCQDGYWMWFCHRKITDYHGAGAGAYRLGLAWSPDAQSWTRLRDPQIFDTAPGPGDFDQHMQCYPAQYRDGDRCYVFYNGSDHGQTGIGVAECVRAQ